MYAASHRLLSPGTASLLRNIRVTGENASDAGFFYFHTSVAHSRLTLWLQFNSYNWQFANDSPRSDKCNVSVYLEGRTLQPGCVSSAGGPDYSAVIFQEYTELQMHYMAGGGRQIGGFIGAWSFHMHDVLNYFFRRIFFFFAHPFLYSDNPVREKTVLRYADDL